MDEAPEPPRRLEWPDEPHPLGEEPEHVVDPAGNWLPEAEPAAADFPADSALDSLLFRRDARWAPQHGAAGRSDSALPGAFLFPDAEQLPIPAIEADGSLDAVHGLETDRSHHWVREVVETLLLAFLVFLAVRASIQHYRVEGHSMDPTLQDGEFLLVNSLVYSQVDLSDISRFVPFWETKSPDVRHVFHAPQRGDIIILAPRQREQRDLVKRIIGTPGDTFEIREGVVFVNGRELIEPYIKVPWTGNLAPIRIPAHEYFVMGDNRNQSLDSRAFGLVEEDDIIGKAMASWWPKEKWGLAPNETPKLAPAK